MQKFVWAFVDKESDFWDVYERTLMTVAKSTVRHNYVCISVCVYVRMCIYRHVYMCIKSMCMYICMCVCVLKFVWAFVDKESDFWDVYEKTLMTVAKSTVRHIVCAQVCVCVCVCVCMHVYV